VSAHVGRRVRRAEGPAHLLLCEKIKHRVHAAAGLVAACVAAGEAHEPGTRPAQPPP
jgi:hypothetical protein